MGGGCLLPLERYLVPGGTGFDVYLTPQSQVLLCKSLLYALLTRAFLRQDAPFGRNFLCQPSRTQGKSDTAVLICHGFPVQSLRCRRGPTCPKACDRLLKAKEA